MTTLFLYTLKIAPKALKTSPGNSESRKAAAGETVLWKGST